MGGGCTKTRIITKENDPDIGNKRISLENKKLLKRLSNIQMNSGNIINVYSLFQFKNSKFRDENLLIFPYQDSLYNQFIVLDQEYNESIKYNSNKWNGIGVGYSKGNKADYYIQDKFFVLLDGNIEVFCLVDGHGPFGNIVAQIIQDKIFQVNHNPLKKYKTYLLYFLVLINFMINFVKYIYTTSALVIFLIKDFIKNLF